MCALDPGGGHEYTPRIGRVCAALILIDYDLGEISLVVSPAKREDHAVWCGQHEMNALNAFLAQPLSNFQEILREPVLFSL